MKNRPRRAKSRRGRRRPMIARGPDGRTVSRPTTAWTHPVRVRQASSPRRTPPDPRRPPMIRWTGFVIAHRKRIVAAWLVLFALGGYAAANLGDLLSNRFSVPGSESERGLELLKDRMGDRSDGAFTVVATGVGSRADAAAVTAAARRA